LSWTKLALGLTIILVSNAVLLTIVARNRSGSPIRTIELTERELPMLARGDEDSSVSLLVTWKPNSFVRPGGALDDDKQVGLFDDEKLRSLGFSCGIADSKSPLYRVPQRRLAFVALEYTVNPLEEHTGPARPAAGWGRGQSGLMVVDASTSLDQLLSKYPDSRKYMIVRGIVRASTHQTADAARAPVWRGRVESVLPPQIYVPLPYSTEFNRKTSEEQSRTRYTVTLRYGRNLEPWIESISMSSR